MAHGRALKAGKAITYNHPGKVIVRLLPGPVVSPTEAVTLVE
ncbi:hypothetical protein ACX6XY_04955 [Streptomyces sp. O3]